ncbi:hypothetical protein E8E13_008561 [Curvularia kusanoi]|uniref:Uncharacterized protein n=1 Tax=Curvularia kusanoi TaxID=90978 RepID=A0A9P4TI61_CURKU|nr:hypothetical protein E8E13_008561 [Curvularia kusanoi]
MNANTNNNAASGQNEDYLDKGLDAAEKKFGGSMGQDTQKNRAVNEKIPPASMSPRSSPTRASPPPTRLSLDVDESTHPPSTCYEDAHVADSSPKSSRSRTFSIGSIGHKKKHKNRESIDSTASHDSYATADETHGEDDAEKTGILHKVATGMQKARPYVERLSGTYEPMPIQPPDHTK